MICRDRVRRIVQFRKSNDQTSLPWCISRITSRSSEWKNHKRHYLLTVENETPQRNVCQPSAISHPEQHRCQSSVTSSQCEQVYKCSLSGAETRRGGHGQGATLFSLTYQCSSSGFSGDEAALVLRPNDIVLCVKYGSVDVPFNIFSMDG